MQPPGKALTSPAYLFSLYSTDTAIGNLYFHSFAPKAKCLSEFNQQSSAAKSAEELFMKLVYTRAGKEKIFIYGRPPQGTAIAGWVRWKANEPIKSTVDLETPKPTAHALVQSKISAPRLHAQSNSADEKIKPKSVKPAYISHRDFPTNAHFLGRFGKHEMWVQIPPSERSILIVYDGFKPNNRHEMKADLVSSMFTNGLVDEAFRIAFTRAKSIGLLDVNGRSVKQNIVNNPNNANSMRLSNGPSR